MRSAAVAELVVPAAPAAAALFLPEAQVVWADRAAAVLRADQYQQPQQSRSIWSMIWMSQAVSAAPAAPAAQAALAARLAATAAASLVPATAMQPAPSSS